MKETLEIIQSILTSILIFIGSGWVLYRFILQQERFPNINFTTDINIIRKQSDCWIVELIANVENKGKAQHKMSEFGFDLNAMYEQDEVQSKEEWGGQVDFSHRLILGSYLPKHQKYFFVDPGTTAKYSYITKVPLSTRFLMLHSNLMNCKLKPYKINCFYSLTYENPCGFSSWFCIY